jgi:mitochondrial import inner membrane translocase subunit TIM13
MAFGGFFGGNDNDKDKNTSSSTTSPQTPSIQNPLSTSFPTSSSSTLQKIQSAITEQANVANAKQLISNVNTNCFEKCIPSPSGALSGGESKCLTMCMEKFIDAWNVASRTYTGRLQRESTSFAGGLQSGGGGKEMF